MRLLAMGAVLCIGCNTVPIDSSQLAFAAGQSTVAIGGCDKPLDLGWTACRRQRGVQLPSMNIMFTNPGTYAISDCALNLWRTGSATQGQLVEIPLAELTADADRRGFCLLKVETEEVWGDNRRIPMAGGFFIETLDPSYFPVPQRRDIAWCYRVARTTAGRTVVEQCQ